MSALTKCQLDYDHQLPDFPEEHEEHECPECGDLAVRTKDGWRCASKVCSWELADIDYIDSGYDGILGEG